MLDLIIKENWITANAVIGIWPANTCGPDEIEIYTDNSRTELLANTQHLRQQLKKAPGIPNLSLADFIAPKDSGLEDYIGGFVVTAGGGIEEQVKRFDADHDDYSSIMLKALADRFAEAFAERLHQKVRTEIWGYGSNEALSNADLIKEAYRGIRPAPGYPACPDHTEKITLFELLDAEKHTSVKLTESLAMYPAASVSGWYFAHPEAKYFGLGKIQKDQVADIALRKGLELEDMSTWLSTNLVD